MVARAEVVLHIGAFKTGTSFIQSALSLNRSTLADGGILFPGKTWPEQVHAVRDLAGRSVPEAPVTARTADTWDRIAEECRRWDGPLAVFSMEFLSTARPEVVRAAIRSFDPKQVRVVYTARDLTYAIPAQWQESLQSSRRTWTLRQYAEDVMRPVGQFNDATKHFWRKHNWQRVLHRWVQDLPASQVSLVSFPRPGSDPAELWHRFGVAAGFDATRYPIPALNNESLGAESLEVARRVNVEAASRGVVPIGPTFRRVLCKTVMAARKPVERTVAFPGDLTPWVAQRTERLITKVQRLGPGVVGSLDDLRPRPPEDRPNSTSHTEDLSIADLLPAAESAAAGLAEALGTHWEPAPGDLDARLRSAIVSMADLTT